MFSDGRGDQHPDVSDIKQTIVEVTQASGEAIGKLAGWTKTTFDAVSKDVDETAKKLQQLETSLVAELEKSKAEMLKLKRLLLLSFATTPLSIGLMTLFHMLAGK